MSAASSSCGGLAGFISIGFAVPKGATETGFAVGRRWPLFVAGLLATLAFALILGPSIRFGAWQARPTPARSRHGRVHRRADRQAHRLYRAPADVLRRDQIGRAHV